MGMNGGSLVISVLDCPLRDQGLKSLPGQKFLQRFLLHLCPLINSLNSALMGTLTIHSQWENETARKRTNHLPFHEIQITLCNTIFFPGFQVLYFNCLCLKPMEKRLHSAQTLIL